MLENLPDHRPFPEAVVEKREQEKLVRDSLERLPKSFREVLTLVDMEGLDYQEVAEAIGVPLGTIKSRLARARLQFRRVLAGAQYPVEL
jgi:RNA polymerase sigma-70 factor (ECF subfamily)